MVSTKIFCALALLALLVPLTAAFQEWNPSFFYSNQKCYLPEVSCGECVEKGAVVSSDCKLVGASVHSEQCYGGFVQFKVLDTLNTTICLNESSDSCMNLSAPIIIQVNDSFLGRRYWCSLEPEVYNAQFAAYPQTNYITANWSATNKANYTFTVYNPDAEPRPFLESDSSATYAYAQKSMIRAKQPDIYNVTITACNALGFCGSYSQFVSLLSSPGVVNAPIASGIDGKSFKYEDQPLSFQVKLTGNYANYHYFYQLDSLPVSEGGFQSKDSTFTNGLQLLPSGQHTLTLTSRHYPYSANTTVHFTIQPTQNPDYINQPQITSPTNGQAFSYASDQPIKTTFKVTGTFASYDVAVEVDGKMVSTVSCPKNTACEATLPTQDGGSHSLKLTAYAQAFSNSSSVNFTVTPAQTVLALSIQPSAQVPAGTQTTVKCLSNPSSAPVQLRRNSATVSNPDVQTLAKGHYNYSCSVVSNPNYAPAYESTDVWTYSMLNPVTLTLNGVNTDLSVNYKTAVTAEASAQYGVPKLYLDGAQVSNPFSATLSAGYYNFTAYVEGNSSMELGSATRFLTINKIAPVLRIFLSPSSSVTEGTETNASCNSYGVPGAVFTRNAAPANNPDVATFAVGTYLYECTLPESENYTAITATPKTLTVTAPSPFWAPLEQAANSITSAAANAWQWAAKLLG